MIPIKLPHGEWQYDPNSPLGPAGGFGEVFAGTADGFGPLAVKRIKLSVQDTAHRELRIAEELAGRQLLHVMAVLDSGQDAESDLYFVVMPIVLAKTVFRSFYCRMGRARYTIMALLLLMMVMLPVKMILRWTLNLSYIVSIPEYLLNF